MNEPKLYKIGEVVEYVDLIDRSDEATEIRLSDRAKWFCAITNPNCQRRAELELYSLGFRTFTPKMRKWVSHARVKKAVERPLLGRYLFVEVDLERQSFFAVRAVNGVEGVISGPVMTDTGIKVEPMPIPPRYVESFRMRQMAGEWDFVRKEALPIGARIRIVEGEFDDMLATITARRRGKLDVKIHGTSMNRTIYEHSARAA